MHLQTWEFWEWVASLSTNKLFDALKVDIFCCPESSVTVNYKTNWYRSWWTDYSAMKWFPAAALVNRFPFRPLQSLLLCLVSSPQAAAVTRSPTEPPTGRCQTSVKTTCRHGGRRSASLEPPCPSTSTCPTRATRADTCQPHSARRRTIKRREDARAGVLPPLL